MKENKKKRIKNEIANNVCCNIGGIEMSVDELLDWIDELEEDAEEEKE